MVVCEARDPKGLYCKAGAGKIAAFTDFSAPYQSPLTLDLVLDTSSVSVNECVAHVLRVLDARLAGVVDA